MGVSRAGARTTSGGLILLEQHSANSSATLDFTNFVSATYDEYIFEFTNVTPATTNVDFYIRMSTNGGSSYDSGSNYTTAVHAASSAGGVAAGSVSTTQIMIRNTGEISNTVSRGGVSGHMRLFNPLSTSVEKRVAAHFTYFTDRAVTSSVSGHYASSSAVNAIRFFFSSGNIASGTIRVYGVSIAGPVNLASAGVLGGYAPLNSSLLIPQSYLRQMIPSVTNVSGGFSSSSTTCSDTMTAPTTGDNLVMLVNSTGRGADSITQTNVTWTNRYSGNGNSQWLEVWTGVVSGTGGTTATVNFTGSNTQSVDSFVMNGVTNFTSAVESAHSNAASTALATLNAGTTLNSLYIWAVSAEGPVSSYSGMNQPFKPINSLGGQSRNGIFYANGDSLTLWSLSSSAVNYFAAVVAVS